MHHDHTTEKGTHMSKPSDTFRSLLHRLGVAGPARVRACKGTGAPLILLLALGVLALTSTPALAGSSHIFSHTLGSGRGEGAGELELTAPVMFEKKNLSDSPPSFFNVAGSGVAVDDVTHDIYVADTGNHRVDEFEADGTFIRTFGKDVNKTKAAEGVLATEAEKNVCSGGPEECQQGAVGSEPGALEAPQFVAVDQTTGDVYVGDGVGRESDRGVREAPNELQDVETNATSGTYTLSFEGETTAPIAYVQDAFNPLNDDGPDSQAAQKALEALPSIGPGNVEVHERGEESPPYTTRWLEVEFVGTLAEKAVPLLTADSSGLTPAGANIEVIVERQGSPWVGEVISKFNEKGELQKGWGANGQLTDAGGEHGPFAGQLDGIAVDTAGDLWLVDGNANEYYRYEFEQDGAFVPGSAVRLGGYGSAGGIAVGAPGELHLAKTEPAASGIVLDTAENEVYEDFGTSIKSARESFTSPELEAGGGAGLAVDSSVGTAVSSGTVYAANSSSDLIEAFGIALGVNPTSPGSATEVTASAATLNGVIDPEGLPVTECYFEYGETSEYSQSAPCSQGLGEGLGEIGKGTSPVPVSAKLTALHGGTTYHYRLVAGNANGIIEGADETFTTPTVPLVTGGEAANITASGAELRASVNPEGLQVSRCTFEYGTSMTYGAREPCEQRKSAIGSGTAPVPVSVQISGLSPNTTYYWRLRVEDVDGEAFEPGHTFVYPTTTTSVELPDHRAYEMVTPPQKNGTLIGDTFADPNLNIAESGQRLIAPSIQCFDESPSCTGQRDTTGDPFEFTRTEEADQCEPQAPPCWVTTPLAPPATMFSENTARQWNAEAGTALFSVPRAGPPGLEDEWLGRTAAGSFLRIGPRLETSLIQPAVEGATADLSHVVWENPLHAVNQQYPPAVYEIYTGGGDTRAFPVAVNNEGKPIGCDANLGSGRLGSAWNFLSADGRTIYFGCEGGALYARVDGELPDAHTVTISEPQCEDSECRTNESHPRAAVFDTASEDGSRAFFLDTQQLTDEATQSTGNAGYGVECSSQGNDCNLYESQCTSECEEAGEQRGLIDVSAPQRSGEAPRVQGVVATSADGSHVYFVAQGVLTATPNRQGQSAHSGGDNLYVYERDSAHPEGRLAFITSLVASDSHNWSPEEEHRANVTPDGRFLVFQSFGDLTPGTHAGGAQVFRYDAETEQLLRVSIGADGYDDDGNAGSGEATIVGPSEKNAGPVRGDPSMSNDGARVFFMSPRALTPHALDDVPIGGGYYAQNVYEWEREAAGSCPAGQSVGCLYLISAPDAASAGNTACANRGINLGASESAVCLLGTDAEGRNVFFMTADRLVPKDTDTQADVYDARICEPEAGNPCITEPPPALPPCDGESCHGIPEPTPSLLAPGSASFNGEGNTTPVVSPPPKKVTTKTVKCRKGFVKKKVKKKELCVKAKSKKKGKGASRATHDRRTQS
jgi:hypothetical protein